MLKKIFDRSIAALAIILLSPIMVLISFLIMFLMGTPIIFHQKDPVKMVRFLK